MTLYSPLHAQNLSYSATLDRQLIDVIFSGGGVIGATDLIVTQRGAGANMSVDVAAGKVIVVGTDNAGQGKYLCWSDATVNVPIATAPGTGNTRIDLIVAQVRDADQNGGANNDWILTAVTGTPATTGTQVAPALPASSYSLATVTVGPTVTSILTANIAGSRITGNNIDTGWITATGVNAGWSSNVQYRKKGNVVRLRQNALRSSGVISGPFTLPVGYRPPTNTQFFVADATTGNSGGVVTISTAGVVACSTPDNLFYDGINYTVD